MSDETKPVNFTADECRGVMDAIDALIVGYPAELDAVATLKSALLKVKQTYDLFPPSV